MEHLRLQGDLPEPTILSMISNRGRWCAILIPFQGSAGWGCGGIPAGGRHPEHGFHLHGVPKRVSQAHSSFSTGRHAIVPHNFYVQKDFFRVPYLVYNPSHQEGNLLGFQGIRTGGCIKSMDSKYYHSCKHCCWSLSKRVQLGLHGRFLQEVITLARVASGQYTINSKIHSRQLLIADILYIVSLIAWCIISFIPSHE